MSPRPLRRSQAISPFGVGAMVDFPGPVSLIHCGLDAWSFDEFDPNHREFRIEDEKRLAERLNVRYFVQPPDFRKPQRGEDAVQTNLNLKLPFLRFPRWHVCPRCGLMREAELHDRQAPVCRGPLATGKDKGKPHTDRKMIQVRFIAACKNGHLQDFPWWEWVFQSTDPPKSGRLRMHTSGSASLAGINIVCEEQSNQIKILANQRMSKAFSAPKNKSPFAGIGLSCQGENPALYIPSIDVSSPGCGEGLYTLLRGSSNVYFPKIVSSIYIPPVDYKASEDILEILEDPHVNFTLKMIGMKGELTSEDVRGILDTLYSHKNVDPQEFADAANRKLKGTDKNTEKKVDGDDEEKAYRRQEYNVFESDIHEGYPKTNLLIRSESLDLYGSILSDNFSRISLIHKLRETRAFVGFSRIFPENNLTDKQRQRMISREPKNWLPGSIVRGEGIFLQIKETVVNDWLLANRKKLDRRLLPLQETLSNLRVSRNQDPIAISPRFVLLHTLSHLLINQLIFECGYGSASLRERLYSSDGENPMGGILIYTAAGDSEGTMGGLVRMGKPGKLEAVLLRALENAKWCSTDPVCMESIGQGPDSCNLAACHSCALLPETSCEEQNRLLDRGVLIGTISDPEIGFFSP